MTAIHAKLLSAATGRFALYTFIVTLILGIGIAGVLTILEWLITTCLSGEEMQTLENYSVL